MFKWLKKQVSVWQVILFVLALVSGEFFLVHGTPGHLLIDSDPKLGLDQVVRQLKSELEAMETDRQTKGTFPLFAVNDLDIELGFVIKQDVSTKGKFEFEVVTAEMERKLGQESSHKITLHMKLAPPSQLNGLAPTPGLSTEGAIEFK